MSTPPATQTCHRRQIQPAPRGWRHPVMSALIMGSPARRLINPITRCRAKPHNRYAGTRRRARTPGQGLTQNDSR